MTINCRNSRLSFSLHSSAGEIVVFCARDNLLHGKQKLLNDILAGKNANKAQYNKLHVFYNFINTSDLLVLILNMFYCRTSIIWHHVNYLKQ